jgi:hypothetical protein
MDDEKPRDEDENEQEELYELQDEEEPEQRSQRLNADFLLDKVIPDEIDWRDLVRRHPMLSVGLAAGLGFLIGRSKGAAIIAGASAALSSAIMRQLSDVLDGEAFEF